MEPSRCGDSNDTLTLLPVSPGGRLGIRVQAFDALTCRKRLVGKKHKHFQRTHAAS
jgi:hypothetical protein